ncbi:MAG: hypothetical protein ACOYNP_19545, partial [Gemmataceae bacterium]
SLHRPVYFFNSINFMFWRRNQLTCPSDQEIVDYQRGELAIIHPKIADHLQFHLTSIRCIYCISTAAEWKQSAAKGGTN